MEEISTNGEVNRELFNPVKTSIGETANFIINPFPTLSAVFNLVPEQYIVLGSNTGVGKAIWDNERVLTPTGWKTHGALKVGDYVIGSDGLPTRVQGVYPQGVRPLFMVKFQDGTGVVCDAEHLWKVDTIHGEEVKSTKELYESGLITRTSKGSMYKYKVKLPEACHIAGPSVSERELFISETLNKHSSTIVNHQLRMQVIDYARSLGWLVVNRIDVYIDKEATHKAITSIEFECEDYCSCIKVDAEDSMYVVNGYNLTHNTSFIDHMLLSVLQNHSKDLHVEVLYYSMERKKKFKYAKWISWKLKQKENTRLSSDAIMNRDGKLSIERMEYLEKTYGPWLNGILDFIDIREGPRTVKEIEADIEKLARRVGAYFHTDSINIHQNGKIIGTLKQEQFINTKYGKKLFTNLKIDGKEYILYQNDSLYIPKKKSMVFVVIDHIGKVKVSEGGKKATLDLLDEVLANARDKYSFSPIAISQFNRSIGATDRLKLNKGDLTPTLEDFKDTGNLVESADLVISLFDPARYKSYNSEGEYKGYNILDSMVTPLGQQRSRSLHVLKNTFGFDNTTTVLRFTGESMYFEALPNPRDTVALDRIYKDIAKGN